MAALRARATTSIARGTPNTGNFIGGPGFAVTGSPFYSASQNYLTDVGAYMTSAGPDKTFDQLGDVHQWNEAIVSGTNRSSRGASWQSKLGFLVSSHRIQDVPSTIEYDYIGFRVAHVPEPSAEMLAVLACGIV